jgi:hypothetical protein
MLAAQAHGDIPKVDVAAFEGGAVPPSEGQTSSFERVKAVLEAQGWGVQRDPDGNLMLTPKGSGTRQAPEQDPLAGLARALADSGWRVERNARGELLLYPRDTGQTEETGSQGASEPSRLVPAGDLERLQSLLVQKGWRVKRDQDGNLLAYPHAASGAGVASEAATGRTGTDQLQGLLQERGWRTERDSQGHLILYPQGSPPAPETPAESSVIPASDLSHLKARLQARGWTVQGDTRTGLTIYPQGADTGAVEAAGSGACQSVIPDPVRTGGIALPVDTWDEAHTIAVAWVNQGRQDGLVVGKIRRIHGIYLVSLVAAHPPYRLRDQLAIRSRDGRTVSLLQ